ncbi:Hypothetical predicted protein [Paramuricea clavata]|uniref:Uncharacterized protein n=1 Tax=Paramuricea clavata TaxID=317549 RepID=A0A6S7GJ97_PARCT|nr:Hypothetical predicted protein [Paramuricea clavata]
MTSTTDAFQGGLTPTTSAFQGRLTPTTSAFQDGLTPTTSAFQGGMTLTTSAFQPGMTTSVFQPGMTPTTNAFQGGMTLAYIRHGQRSPIDPIIYQAQISSLPTYHAQQFSSARQKPDFGSFAYTRLPSRVNWSELEARF